MPVTAVRRRQVFDLPDPAPIEVTEYAAEVKPCPGCDIKAAGVFPAGVESPAQYGPEVTAKVADAVLGHHIPVHRATLLVMELCAVYLSAGFAASLRGRAARLLEESFLPAVRALFVTAPVVHADETFTRTAGATRYLHVAATERLSLRHAGDCSAATIDTGQVLPHLSGVLVRDGSPDTPTWTTFCTPDAAPTCCATCAATTRRIPRASCGPVPWPTHCWEPTASRPPPAKRAVTR
ncbi:IS66 family transposase [Streptomyces mirabilis]|uniref:IS66 family transposase n=1 Tax=Streptomyces mirabilis TaxID=68239 RepID=UPI003648FEFD